jgi:hypothetical protein
MCEEFVDGVSATYAGCACRHYGADGDNGRGYKCKMTADASDAGAHAPAEQCRYRACGHHVAS